MLQRVVDANNVSTGDTDINVNFPNRQTQRVNNVSTVNEFANLDTFISVFFTNSQPKRVTNVSTADDYNGSDGLWCKLSPHEHNSYQRQHGQYD